MVSRNLFVISGNVSQTPRQFGDKALKTVVTIAVDEFWTDRESGERKRRTDFLTAYTFNKKIGDFIQACQTRLSSNDRRPHPVEFLREGERARLHDGS